MSTSPLSIIGDDGVDVGESSRNLTYLYGLSDFFSFLFEDTDTLNLFLEANSLTASEVYSRFLQLTSSLSLENIQTFTGTSIKLILVKSSDREDPSLIRYTVNIPIEKIKLLSNRPFLPTEILEENVDFRVIRKDIDSSYIQFAKPLADYKFSSRVNSNGESEYAIWLSDVLIDEQLMLKHFGELIAVTPEISSEAFSNFIYGLYYVYMNGPTLGILKRGLNLVLGAPLARSNESVLDIRGYLGSDQFLVITDQNQYLLPFGLEPSVEVGDDVSLGQLLAEWVEVKDYVHDGNWWINVTIPSKLIPAIPPGQVNRFAVEGSPYDTIMKDYLSKNSFLVKVTVGNFKNTQQFAQITDIINRAKPAHTQPVYIWVVPSDNLTINLQETEQKVAVRITDIDYIGFPIEMFRRNNLIMPVKRGGAFFNRRCVPSYVSELAGEETELGLNQRDYFDGSGVSHPVTGFRAFKSAFITPDVYDTAWIQAVSATGNYTYRQQANQYSALGSVAVVTSGAGATSYRGFSDFIASGKRVIALYSTFLSDIRAKLITAGISPSVIDTDKRGFIVGGTSFLINNFTALFHKTPNLGSLGPEFPPYSYDETSVSLGELTTTDQLYVQKTTNLVVAVYWVTTNTTFVAPSLTPVLPWDRVQIKYTTPLNRSGATSGAPWYLTRGGALVNWGDTAGSYTDANNLTPLSINRSMGASSWPSSGTLLPFNHVAKA